MEAQWECVVVGGGAAGLSAALVLGRARRRTLVVDRGGQSNRPAEHIGGLLGQVHTSPADFYASAHEQLAEFDTVKLRDAEAQAARTEGEGFVVSVDDEEITTRTILLATGMDYHAPDIPGFAEQWGNGVVHCPFCHGWEVRDKRIVVCADAEVGEHMPPLLGAWSNDVTLVDPSDVAGLRSEDGAPSALELKDGSEISCDAVFVRAPLKRRRRLTDDLGLEITDLDMVEVDKLLHTSVPGVYAAGDLAVAPQSVAISMGSGNLVGASIVRELTLGR